MKKFIIVIMLMITCPLSGTLRAEVEEISEQAGFGPAIEVPETDIYLETLAQDGLEVTGEIFFVNTGDQPLQIKNVSCPCACFAGYFGDQLVLPGESGVLEVRLTRSKIPSGDATRIVIIESNDPINDRVQVDFHFTIERSPIEEELYKVNQEVTILRNELQVVHRDLEKALQALEGNIRPPQPPRPEPDLTVYDIPIGSSPVLGPEDAPVTIVEFVDLECPFCSREYPKIKHIMGLYEDRIKLVFKHFPLEFHQKAGPAHAAVQLALDQRGQEAFWQMHDMIMAQPTKLDIQDLRGYASDLDLILGVFDEVMADEGKMNELLNADKAEAARCKVNGTPTVLINGLKLQSRGVSDYQKRIDEILAQADALAADSHNH